jgi:hypothetical protein
LQPPGTYHVAGGEAEAEAGVHGDRAPWGELESLLRRWCRLGGSWHSCAALLRAHWAVKQQQQTDLEWRQGRFFFIFSLNLKHILNLTRV